MSRWILSRVYVTWLGCKVTERYVTLPGGGFGAHIELET